MGPTETKALEMLLAISRGMTYDQAIFAMKDGAAATLLHEWQLVHAHGTLTVKGQDLARLIKDQVSFWMKYGSPS